MRGSCRFCLMSFVYSSSIFCAGAAALVDFTADCAAMRGEEKVNATTSATDAPPAASRRDFMKDSFVVALHSRPRTVSVSTRDFAVRLQDRWAFGDVRQRIRPARRRAHRGVAERARLRVDH